MKQGLSKILARVVIAQAVLFNFAFAASGISKVDNFLSLLQTILYGVGVTVFTIAIMWCGFKMWFQNQGVMQVAPVFIGGLLVAAASAIAGYLLG